jgi:hypothetical protein
MVCNLKSGVVFLTSSLAEIPPAALIVLCFVFGLVAAGIDRRPAGFVHIAAAADGQKTTFDFFHLGFVQIGDKALHFELLECNFFLFHATNSVERLGMIKC